MISGAGIFSGKHREEIWAKPESCYDVLIIGGGITGAGIFLDAVLNQLDVLLLEQNDFASGTSSKSTKLIHGGLRYLKQLELSLVKEVGRERAIVYRNAIPFVRPEPMILPIVEGGSLSKWTCDIALRVYDFLAQVPASERRKMMNSFQAVQTEPLLSNEKVKGAGYYFEYRTDDARLTIQNIKSGVQKGGHALSYSKVIDFIYKNGRIEGVKVQNLENGEIKEFHSRVVVNASGPWLDSLRLKDETGFLKKIIHSKGSHIVVDQKSFPIKQAIYFDMPRDKRMIFAIPRGSVTYIGTTDLIYNGDLDQLLTKREEVEYLLDAVNSFFDHVNLKLEDVQSSWIGVRPLIEELGKSVSEVSRKDEIFISYSGLISIAGGKLTGYRKMAEKLLKPLSKLLGKKLSTKTLNFKIYGADFVNESAYVDFRKKILDDALELGLPEQQVLIWVERYGSDFVQIFEKGVQMHKEEKIELIFAFFKAEILYAIQNESVLHLNDFLIRRTGFLYFQMKELDIYLSFLAACFAEFLGWDDIRVQTEIASIRQEQEKLTNFL